MCVRVCIAMWMLCVCVCIVMWMLLHCIHVDLRYNIICGIVTIYICYSTRLTATSIVLALVMSITNNNCSPHQLRTSPHSCEHWTTPNTALSYLHFVWTVLAL